MCHPPTPANALYWALISIFFLTWTSEFSCFCSHIIPVLSVTPILFHLILLCPLSRSLCTSPSGYPPLSVHGLLCMCVFIFYWDCPFSSLDSQALSPLSDFPSLSSFCLLLSSGLWLRVPLPHVCLTPPLSGLSVCVWEECPHVHVGSPAHHGAPSPSVLSASACLPATCAMSCRCGGRKVAVCIPVQTFIVLSSALCIWIC